jgi:hypothetical protein
MNPYAGVDLAEVNRDLEAIEKQERAAMTEADFEAYMDNMFAAYNADMAAAESYDEDAIFYGAK